jgi:hypothetical protein
MTQSPDIYELARPMRDAAIAEVLRLTGGADFSPDARAANILGVSLTAIILAFAADRHKQTGGLIRDEGLHFVLPAAIATMIANAAMAFRPLYNGKPVPASAVAHSMLHDICVCTMEQTAINESGGQDFVIPFRRTEAGDLEVTSFDFNDMLKGKP